MTPKETLEEAAKRLFSKYSNNGRSVAVSVGIGSTKVD